MSRQYTSMEEELRALKDQGSTGMSQGFSYTGKRRNRSTSMTEENQRTVSTWSLRDKDTRRPERPSGARGTGFERTAGQISRGSGFERPTGQTARGTGFERTAAGSPSGGTVPSGNRLRPATGTRASAGTRPAAGTQAAQRRKQPGSTLLKLIIFFVVVSVLVSAVIEVIFSRVVEHYQSYEPDEPAGTEQEYEYGEESDYGEENDPVFNPETIKVFFAPLEGAEVTADWDEVDDFVWYFDPYDLSGASLPDEFNCYAGSRNGGMLVTLTFWEYGQDQDKIAELKQKALQYMREAEPEIRAALDEEFGDGAVPLAMSLYDFSAGHTLLIFRDGEVIYEAE